jgi:arabinose-5-phosphate isomerase
MHKGDLIPLVSKDKEMKEVIVHMTQMGLGIVGTLDENGNLVGAISDGDLRRGLEHGTTFLTQKASEIMSLNPKRILKDNLAIDALKIMEQFSITSLFVFSEENDQKPIGIIHIHDILKYGIMT